MTAPMLDEHERALDYLYGLLDGEDKARFEAHLAGCARCQAELDANGRVRQAAKSVLPPVEPTERLTGALHAQLMHEAGKREPRGKVLPFVRRLVRHPAYAVAAGLLIVGGAVGVQWSRGKLTMAPAEPAASAPKPEAQPVPVAGAAKSEAVPPVEPPAPPPADESAADKKVATKNLEYAKEVSSPPPAPAKLKAMPAADAVPAPKRTSRLAKDGAPFAEESLDGAIAGDNSYGARSRAIAGGGKGSGEGMLERKPAVEKPAPMQKADDLPSYATRDRNEVAKHENKKRGSLDLEDALASAPASQAAPTAPPPEPIAEPKAAAPGRREAEQAQSSYGSVAQGVAANEAGASATPAPAALSPRNQDPVEIQRSRANRFAQDERCTDAVRLYGDIDRRAPDKLTSQDRLSYARCLRVLGLVGPAQNELDQASRQMPQRAIAAEQQALDDERRKQTVSRSKAAKRNSALDSAQPAPANAAPAKK